MFGYFQFHKSIADLVVNDTDTLVLYSDGTCEPLQTAIESRKDDGPKYSQQIELVSSLSFTNATVHNLPNGSRILTYFERNIKTGDYHLVRISLQKGNNSKKRFKLKRGILDVQVAGAAVIEGEGGPVLLTICKYICLKSKQYLNIHELSVLPFCYNFFF